MNEIKPTGQERVNYNLEKALLQIEKLKNLETKKTTHLNQKRIESLKIRISNVKKKLVFLSIRARDKVTKFYASNALKEIAQKLKE
jgi:hypothetical protein